MKKILLFALAAVICLTACVNTSTNKKDPDRQDHADPDDRMR